MAKITHIEIPSAQSAIGNLSEIIGDFAESLAEVKRVANDLHGCWGSDEGGRTFAEGYVTNAETLFEGSDKSVEALREVEKFLRDAVRAFEELDVDGGEFLEYGN